MPADGRTVLITGCSDGGLGAALATVFHEKGFKVFATARNLSKTQNLESKGIQCLSLDVLSDESIQSCVKEVSSLTSGTLDILINNAGGGHYEPFLHLDLSKAKDLFDKNVWACLAVTQAFLPLLMKDKSVAGKQSLLVNHTSISSVLRTPYHSAYGASKAAMAVFSETQRIELKPLGIKVIDLKTGSTKSNFASNRTNDLTLPEGSPYEPIKAEVEKVITGKATEAYAEDQATWAKNVVYDLSKSNPPDLVWRGGMAGSVRLATAVQTLLPMSLVDGQFRQLGGLTKLEGIMREKEK